MKNYGVDAHEFYLGQLRATRERPWEDDIQKTKRDFKHNFMIEALRKNGYNIIGASYNYLANDPWLYCAVQDGSEVRCISALFVKGNNTCAISVAEEWDGIAINCTRRIARMLTDSPSNTGLTEKQVSIRNNWRMIVKYHLTTGSTRFLSMMEGEEVSV